VIDPDLAAMAAALSYSFNTTRITDLYRKPTVYELDAIRHNLPSAKHNLEDNSGNRIEPNQLTVETGFRQHPMEDSDEASTHARRP
jgi:hypothetical protein